MEFTRHEAYQLILVFLASVYLSNRQGFDEEFPALLGAMQLMEDDVPLNMQLWNLWRDITPEVMVDSDLYALLLQYLETIHLRTGKERSEIQKVLELVQADKKALWQTWLDSSIKRLKD
jgi:hypothetical protein